MIKRNYVLLLRRTEFGFQYPLYSSQQSVMPTSWDLKAPCPRYTGRYADKCSYA